MANNNPQNDDGVDGNLGTYYATKHYFTDEPRICFEANPRKSDIEIIHGFIFIPKSHLAAFCTELIEMARVLGVTGQEKGND